MFGMGKIPKKTAPILESEGIQLADEGLSGGLTYRKFRAPGRYHSYRHVLFAGSLVITNKRFIAFAFKKPVVNIMLKDKKLLRLDISVPESCVLLIRFDVSDFHETWSGNIECRYDTCKAQAFLKWIETEMENRREGK